MSQKLDEFAAAMQDGLNNIEADLLKLKELVQSGASEEEIITALQPVLDRIAVIKEIEPGN